MDEKPTSHGIEALIARLHGEGVESGRREAERLVAQARAAAAEILARAHAEADALRAQARAAAEAEREAVVHAFDLAKRDALLALKDELCVQLAGRLRRLVAREIADPDLLRQTVLAAVGSDALPGDAERLLGEATRSLFEEGAGPDAARGGVRFRLADGDVVVEVTDATLAQLLAEHLMPRFRARLDGSHAD